MEQEPSPFPKRIGIFLQIDNQERHYTPGELLAALARWVCGELTGTQVFKT